MGLRTRTVVESATCDACKTAIPEELLGASGRAHYGVLRSAFGFGSPLDHVGGCECVLCEACWRKACAALGLDPSTLRPQLCCEIAQYAGTGHAGPCVAPRG